MLDVAEELLDDPATVGAVADGIGSLLRGAADLGRRAAGAGVDLTGRPGRDHHDGGPDDGRDERRAVQGAADPSGVVRVLRLDLSGGPLALHPFVTVVRGCSPAEREELLAALADVPRGVARVAGLIESHGVLFDLDDDNLALLELATDLDVVVSPQDLPNADSLDATSVAAAERALGEARAQLSAAEAHLVAALTSARRPGTRWRPSSERSRR